MMSNVMSWALVGRILGSTQRSCHLEHEEVGTDPADAEEGEY